MKCPMWNSIFCRNCDERSYGCKGEVTEEVMEVVNKRFDELFPKSPKKRKQKKGYIWIPCYKRKKKYGQRKTVTVNGYWRKTEPRKKVYIEVEDEKDGTG